MEQQALVTSKFRLFSIAIFKNNLRRFFFLPIIHLAFQLFAGPGLVGIRSGDMVTVFARDLDVSLDVIKQSLVIGFCNPVYIMIGSILVAVALSSYLYVQKNAYMMHAFPIKRSSLHFTNMISGLFMIIIPYVITALIFALSASGAGIEGTVEIFAALGYAVLMTLFFYGLATLCCMLTGNLLGAFIIYFIFNFIQLGISLICSLLAAPFLWGAGYDISTETILTPVVRLTKEFTTYYIHWWGNEVNVGYVVGCAVVGGVFLLISFAVYKYRQVECAGSLLPVAWMRPVFRWGMSFAVASILILIMTAVANNGDINTVLGYYIVGFIIFGFITFIFVQMLVKKSPRIFNKKLIAEGILMVACFVVIAICMRGDVLGISKVMPDLDRISKVTVASNSQVVTYRGDDSNVYTVLELHRDILDNYEELRAHDVIDDTANYDGNAERCNIRIIYTMDSGETLHRYYGFWFYQGSDEAARIGNKINGLFKDSSFALRALLPWEYDESLRLEEATITSYRDDIVFRGENGEALEHLVIEDEMLHEFVKSVKKDIRAGKISTYYSVYSDEPDSKIADVEMHFTTKGEEGYTRSGSFFQITPECTNIIDLLEEWGYKLVIE